MTTATTMVEIVTEIEKLIARLDKALLYLPDGDLTTLGEEAATALRAMQAEAERLRRAGMDAAEDWEECLGHVVSAMGQKPDWYDHEKQAIADFRAALTTENQTNG